MSLFKQKSNSSFFLKMLFSYLGLVFMTVFLISAVIYNIFYEKFTAEVGDISKNMLSQLSHTSTELYDQVSSIYEFLINDKDVISSMFSKDRDKLRDYSMMQKLVKLKNIFPSVKFIGIFNGATDTFLNTGNYNMFYYNELLDKIIKTDSRRFYTIIPCIFDPEDTAEATTPDQVLAFVFYYNFSNSPREETGALVIGVDCKYIKSMVTGMELSKDENILIVNSEGLLISSNETFGFFENIGNQDYLQKIFQSKDFEGFFTTSIEGRQSLVTYVKSHKLGLIYVDIKAYNQFASNLGSLRNIIAGLLAFIFGFGTIASVFLAKRLYHPIGSLLKKIGSLTPPENGMGGNRNELELISRAFKETVDDARVVKNDLKEVFPIIINNYLISLLEGNSSAELLENTKLKEKIQSQLAGPTFCILLIRLDELADGGNTFFHRNILNNLSKLISNNPSTDAGKSELNRNINLIEYNSDIVILVQPNNVDEYLALPLAFKEIQACAQEHSKISFSASIGPLVETVSQLHVSFECAHKYMEYRFFTGKGSIITFDKIKTNFENKCAYPAEIENEIWRAIRIHNEKAVEAAVNEFIASIRGASHTSCLMHINQLILNTLRHLMNYGIPEAEYLKHYDATHKILDKGTLFEIQDHMIGCYLEISRSLKIQQDNRKTDIIRTIKEFIRKNYSNLNLSVEMAAGEVELSSAYLRKLFKNSEKISFNDYMNNIRLEKAKEMLTDTTAPIDVICEHIGISNHTYFFTLFRSAYGCTPLQFRKRESTQVYTISIQDRKL